MQEIPFIVSVPDDGSRREVKGLFSAEGPAEVRKIAVATLRDNLSRVCEAFGEALSTIKPVGNLRLKEVEVGVEVTAEGGINFIGTVTVGAKAAITLTFADSEK